MRLGHRESVDFDFFSSEPFRAQDLIDSIPFLDGGDEGQFEDNTLTVWVNPIEGGRSVKLQFFGNVGLRVLAKPDVVALNGIVVAAQADLAGTKAKVVNERIELKDYLDV